MSILVECRKKTVYLYWVVNLFALELLVTTAIIENDFSKAFRELLNHGREEHRNTESYLERCQTFEMKRFAKILRWSDLHFTLNVFVKHLILDVCQGFEYAPQISNIVFVESAECGEVFLLDLFCIVFQEIFTRGVSRIPANI